MRIQDTFEYKLVKQITAKENRKKVMNTILGGALLVVTSYFMMYVMMWLMLAIWYA
jgi:hypothetical protein